MIAVSSHKPFDKSPDYAANQTAASATWKNKFKAIYYIGHYEAGLSHKNTMFVRPDGDYPTIKAMANLGDILGGGYVAIINADIVLTEPLLEVEKKMNEMALPAAVSYRHEFNPQDPDWQQNAVRNKEDRGMDIFIATNAIWKMIAKEIPEDLWFGHNLWDSWVCGWMCHHLGYGFRHFTDYRCVFHPKHEGRSQPNLDRLLKNDPYLTRAKRPSPL